MKKENKQMARQRRAMEREKEAKKQKLVRMLTYWGPITLAFVVLIVLIIAIATSDRSGSTADGDSDGVISVEDGGDTDDGDAIGWDDSEVVLYDEDSETDENDGTIALITDESIEAKLGDTVNIDFTGYVDGEEFAGGSTNGAGYDLELGSGSFIDGFEDGIVGHKVGETFDLNLAFPDPYPSDTSLSGKDVVFTTTLNGIYE